MSTHLYNAASQTAINCYNCKIVQEKVKFSLRKVASTQGEPQNFFPNNLHKSFEYIAYAWSEPAIPLLACKISQSTVPLPENRSKITKWN